MTDGAEIRPALPADADAISALTRKAYSPWIALTGREPLPMQVDYREAIQVHDFALVEHGGELLGLIETVPEADALQSHLHEQEARAPDEPHGDELHSDFHGSTVAAATDAPRAGFGHE